MVKINQEEYEVLKRVQKHYDDKFKWVSRNDRGRLWGFKEKPTKKSETWGDGHPDLFFAGVDSYKFQFIQWSDSEPYSITELIKEYESEETEVKKDLNWFKEQLDDIEMNTPMLWSHTSIWMLDRVNELLNQLDEPEVLSHKWVSDNAVVGQYPNGMGYVVPTYKLQNLLVPKQELPVIPKFVAEYLDFAKSDVPLMRVMELANTRNELPKWEREYDWISANDETFARAWLDGYQVEEEPQYIIKTGDERYLSQLALNYVDNPPVTTVHHKKEMAIRFSDRELARKVADLVNNGEVEELEE